MKEKQHELAATLKVPPEELPAVVLLRLKSGGHEWKLVVAEDGTLKSTTVAGAREAVKKGAAAAVPCSSAMAERVVNSIHRYITTAVGEPSVL